MLINKMLNKKSYKCESGDKTYVRHIGQMLEAQMSKDDEAYLQ